jgi:hypothetical protein
MNVSDRISPLESLPGSRMTVNVPVIKLDVAEDGPGTLQKYEDLINVYDEKNDSAQMASEQEIDRASPIMRTFDVSRKKSPIDLKSMS